MRKTYPTDLSDAEWTRLRSYSLPSPKAEERPRIHSLRDILDAIFFYVLKKWLSLIGAFCPRTFLLGLPFTTISEKIPTEGVVLPHPQRVVHAAERKRVGKDPRRLPS